MYRIIYHPKWRRKLDIGTSRPFLKGDYSMCHYEVQKKIGPIWWHIVWATSENRAASYIQKRIDGLNKKRVIAIIE